MPAFDYIALDAQGKKQKGVLEGDSARQIRQQLRDKGWFPTSVEAASSEQANNEKTPFWQSSKGLTAYELALVTRQLATLIQAGIPLEETLKAVAKQSEKPQVQSLLLAVRGKVLEGYPLAQSFAAFPKAFPDLYRATVAAGEKSGHLDLVLQQLADYTENRFTTQKQIQGALIYPIILTTLAIAIVVGLLTYVVPDIVKVFTNSHQQLPFLTRALIAASNGVKTFAPLIVLVLVVGAWLFKKSLDTEKGRYAFDGFVLRVPLVSRISKGANAARFASTLSILSKSGVPLVEALYIAAAVASNWHIRDAILEAAVKVTEGGSISGSLEKSRYFPPMMIQMLRSGETGGELDEMLARSAQMQDRELSSLITTMVGLFEPLMLLVMAGVVLIIVLAIMLPIVSMNSLVH